MYVLTERRLMNMEVRIIEPTVLPLIQSETIIRVCAYCRVSSSSKEQLNSYASQKMCIRDRGLENN